LLFVFDGPGRPPKNGRPTWQVGTQKTKLKKDMLDVLRIPHCQAPSEAEAECARLQNEGIVDAVWSEDSDVLMFGATFVIRNYKDPKGPKDKNGTFKRSHTHVRVYKAEMIKRQHGLDQKDFLLWAILHGNDYDDHKGLKNCGKEKVLAAAKAGHSALLWEGGNSIAEWRTQISEFFKQQNGAKVELPSLFPDLKVYRHCRRPTTSDAQQLAELRRQLDFDKVIDETALLMFMGPTFNLWAEEYLKLMTPILLVRKLALTKPGQEASNSGYAVEVIPWGKTKNFVPGTVKVSFVPRNLTKIDLGFNRQAGLRSDADEPQECITLACVLRKGLGEQFIEITPKVVKKTRKRRPTGPEPDLDGPPTKRSKLPESTEKLITQLNRQGLAYNLPSSSVQEALPPTREKQNLSGFPSSHPEHGKQNEKTPILDRRQPGTTAHSAPTSSKASKSTPRDPAPVFRMPEPSIFDIDDLSSIDSPRPPSLPPNRGPASSTNDNKKQSPTATPLDRAAIAEKRLKRFAVHEEAETSSLACPPTRKSEGVSERNLISSRMPGKIVDLTDD
jgi:Holliday junction resolvase YEN1